jgi:predicted DNA binding protein
MPLFEVTFRVSHDCPIGNISRKYPSLKMFHWCNREHDVLELVIRNQKEYPAIQRELSAVIEIIEEVSDSMKVHLITKTCECMEAGSVSRFIEHLSFLELNPVYYEGGWEYYRIVAFKHEDIPKLMKKLADARFDVEILKKKPYNGSFIGSMAMNTDTLFSDLTNKQIDALMAAYTYGYFNFPRRSNVQTIAEKLDVPRTTFVDHLKKAENKIVAALVPYIQLFRNKQ